MTKQDIEQENEQLRQRIQRECQKLEELSQKEHKKKQLIRSLNQKIYNNYEKYMTL